MLPPLKKAQLTLVPSQSSRKELEQLYARRSAIDALIVSLKKYDRFRETRPEDGNRKTA